MWRDYSDASGIDNRGQPNWPLGKSPPQHAHKNLKMVYNDLMRTNIDIDETLVRKARKLTRLKTKRQIVNKALELLVRSETRKGILRYYGSGVWQGDLKAVRRNRA